MNPCDKCLMPSKIKCCHNCKKDAAKCGNWHKCGEDCEKWEAPIQTNADRIRAMSDEELEEFIRRIAIHYEPWCDKHCNMIGDDNCNICLKKWLKQPAEVEG